MMIAKNNRVYTIGYMITLCCVAALALTFANERWRSRVAANENFEKIKAIVTVLGLVGQDAERVDIVRSYADDVEETHPGSMTVYEGRRGDKLAGYAVEIVGRGKYGPIKGILAIDAASQHIAALDIYDQNETPGLGGRIGTPEWLANFRGVPLVTDGSPGIIISSKVKGPNVVDAITGASKTTYQLGKLINKTIAQFLSGGMALEELNLGLDVDAVTRATPGYPKHLKPPPHLRKEVKRPPFMAPPGIKNLALGRPVSCGMEDEPIIGELDQITDGIKKSGPFDFVELDPGPQWVQIDLGKRQTVHAIAVWHFYKNPTIYNDVIVQVADDAEFANNVRTLFNNDHDDSTGLGAGKDTAYYARWWSELVDARGDDKKGTPARYVRVYSNGGASIDDMTRFVEIQIYGEDN
jgi:Na+-transporting NADH:ubiquinone oxidoreductase subunit NqrC